MNIFHKYVAYLRDNPEGYWFKRKLWGWGWVPARWEGWATIAVFVALIALDIVRIKAAMPTHDEFAAQFIPQFLILLLLLAGVAYLKGEPPRWMWGTPDKRG